MSRVVQRMAAIENSPRDFGTGDLLFRAEIHTVEAIGRIPGVGITELAGMLGVTKGAVSQMVKKLVQKGLVRRTLDPANARLVCLILTPTGRVARDGHEAFHHRMEQVVRDGFPDDIDAVNERFRTVFNELDRILDDMITVGLSA